MKSNNYPSIDGFVHKRRQAAARTEDTAPIPERFLVDNHEQPSETIVLPTEPLAPMPPTRPTMPKLLPITKPQKLLKPRRRLTKKKVIWTIAILLILVLSALGYIGAKAFIVSGKVFNGGNILSLIAPGTPLKTDSQGRTNILLFGTSQDDSAHQNASGGGGLWLTDSIELASIDQKNQTVKLVGIPRDLWVKLDNCDVGNYAKINAVYECGANLFDSAATPGPNYAQQDAAGAKQLMATVASVTGITPQYYVHADYSVLKQAVDAVGGIDVNIVGDGASGIYDTNFDWDCPKGPYTCKNVYYPKDGTYHLDGTQALFLSRARSDSGAYSYKNFGLNRGDFDRQANQQKILIALQKKVTTASVLANPIALNSLLDAFGNNISTNLSGGEIKTMLTFAKALPNTSITQVSLVATGNTVVTTGMVEGQSVVLPTSGTYDFSSIINYLSKQLSTNPAVAENATVAIYNASGKAGAAKTEQTALQQLGLNVDTIGDASSKDIGQGAYTLYDQSQGKKPKTLAQLQSTLGVTAITSALPNDIKSTDDFVIIINQ